MSPTPLRLDSDFSTTWVCGPFADGLNAKRRQRAGAPGSHHTTEYPPAPANVYWPGQTVDGPAVPSPGRCTTESFDVNAGHFGPRVDDRREADGGYSARFSGLNQPPSHGSSPSAGTTSRSRARVAATYARRTPSACSHATSSASCSDSSCGAQPPIFIAHRPRAASTYRL